MIFCHSNADRSKFLRVLYSKDGRGCAFIEGSLPSVRQDSLSSPSTKRKSPPSIPAGDDRFHVSRKLRVYVCDRCGGVHRWINEITPYWGSYVGKDGSVGFKPWPEKIKHTELASGYEEGVYDLTWSCVRCEAERLGIPDQTRVAREMGVYREQRRRREVCAKRASFIPPDSFRETASSSSGFQSRQS